MRFWDSYVIAVGNAAKVTDSVKVRHILATYYVPCLYLHETENGPEGILMVCDPVDNFHWCVAVKYQKHGFPDPDADDFWEHEQEIEDALDEHGEQGFLELLLELAPNGFSGSDG